MKITLRSWPMIWLQYFNLLPAISCVIFKWYLHEQLALTVKLEDGVKGELSTQSPKQKSFLIFAVQLSNLIFSFYIFRKVNMRTKSTHLPPPFNSSYNSYNCYQRFLLYCYRLLQIHLIWWFNILPTVYIIRKSYIPYSPPIHLTILTIVSKLFNII